MKYIEKTHICTHIYTHIRIYARGSYTVHTFTSQKHKERKTRNDNKRHHDTGNHGSMANVPKMDHEIRGGTMTWKKKQTWSITRKD